MEDIKFCFSAIFFFFFFFLRTQLLHLPFASQSDTALLNLGLILNKISALIKQIFILSLECKFFFEESITDGKGGKTENGRVASLERTSSDM